MFINPFPNAFGLDIGDRSIKAVQLTNVSMRHRSPTFQLTSALSIELPKGLIENGELMKPEDVRKCIIELLNKKKGRQTKKTKSIRSPWVVANLPETQGFIKLISLEKNIADITAEDVINEAEKHVPFEPNQYYLDWEIIPQPRMAITTISHILLAAIPKRIADSYTYLLESIGLGVMALEIESLALTRAMITSKKEYTDEARLLLDIGAARTSCIVFDHDMIQFSATIPYAGNILDADIATALKISEEKAEKQKIHYGLDIRHQNKITFTILQKGTDTLIQHIKQAIDFYYSHFSNPNRITHITMSGGGSNLKLLNTILTETLGIECAPGHEWKNLGEGIPDDIDEDVSRGFATAIGLALRAADNLFMKQDII